MGLLTLAVACSPIDWQEPSEQTGDLGPVCFATGADALSTKASNGLGVGATQTPYLPEGARFVCRKYYIGTSGADAGHTHYKTSWLVVNNTKGNSVYRQASFATPAEADKDQHGFDKKAWIFYWQNRKEHVFLAITDLNKATNADYVGGTDKGTLKMDDAHPDATLEEGETTYKANSYNLDTNGIDKWEQQPDIIQACAKAIPQGSDPETNRVKLFFKHCFSCVHVNVKKSTDGSVEDLTNVSIQKVELLGVSKEAYVFYEVDANGDYHAPYYVRVDLRDYTAEQLEQNPYGTAMPMYETTVTGDYLKAYHALAFGQLSAIRVTWVEKGESTPEAEPVKHVVTRKIDSEGKVLKSATRYVFNLELRRGELAILEPKIQPWEIDNSEYKLDGKLDKSSENENNET
mgnify:CR=1 FL=1